MTDDTGSTSYRFCPNCGVEAISGLAFCGACGHSLTKPPEAAAGLESRHTEPVVPTPAGSSPLPSQAFEARSPSNIEVVQWKSTAVILRSDASPRAFMDAISSAIESADYPITERNYADMKITFESRGISWKSWSGDVTTVLISPEAGGSRATFTSKGKPSGTIRISMKSNATTWVARIAPDFGPLWNGPDHGTGEIKGHGALGRRGAKE